MSTPLHIHHLDASLSFPFPDAVRDRSSLSVGALDLDQAVEVPDAVRDALQQGCLAALLQDQAQKKHLTTTCCFCGTSFARSTELAWHLQTVHAPAWVMAQDLAIFMQFAHDGCICDPQPKQARNSHQCPGFRQLAMQFLRLDLPLFVPHLVDPQVLRTHLHPSVGEDLLHHMDTILLTRDFAQLWTTDAVITELSMVCVRCGGRFHPGELLHHILESHNSAGEGLSGYVKQLVQTLTTLLVQCDTDDCPLCRQVYKPPNLSAEDSSHLAQIHLRSQCAAVHQIAFVCAYGSPQRRTSGDPGRRLEGHSDERGVQKPGMEHGCRPRESKRRKGQEGPDTGPQQTLLDFHSSSRQPAPSGGPPCGPVGSGNPESTATGQPGLLYEQGGLRSTQAAYHSCSPVASISGEDIIAAVEVPAGLPDDGGATEESGCDLQEYHGQPASTLSPEVEFDSGRPEFPISPMGPTLSGPDPEQKGLHSHAKNAPVDRTTSGRVPGGYLGGAVPSLEVPVECSTEPCYPMEDANPQQSGRCSQPPSQPGREFGVASDQHQNEVALSADLRTGPDDSKSDQGARQGQEPLTLLQLLAGLSLCNSGSDCYMNSAFLCWAWTICSRSDFQLFDLGVHALDIIDFIHGQGRLSLVTQDWFRQLTHGWLAGEGQQDSSEFLRCLLNESGELFHFRWERRFEEMKEGRPIVSVDLEFEGRVPLELQFPTRKCTPCTVQAMVSQWQMEFAMVKALTQVPDLLCIHIARTVQYRDKAPVAKCFNALHMSDPCEVPCFCPYSDEPALRCTLTSYEPIAILIHLGQTLDCGHYRAALRVCDGMAPGWMITEDGQAAEFVPVLPLWVEENATLVWYRRTHPPCSHSDSSALLAALASAQVVPAIRKPLTLGMRGKQLMDNDERNGALDMDEADKVYESFPDEAVLFMKDIVKAASA
eukprot:Skav227141  [mRNA]  locus=scaffold133:539923:545339:- [translate_table: standard]